MTLDHQRLPSSYPRRWRVGHTAALFLGLLVFLVLLPIGPPAEAVSTLLPPLPGPLRVLREFAPPPEPWDAGNRGVDLAATVGEPVFAAASGVVIYAGLLAGRGVISVEDNSIHVTYEPVDPIVATGSPVVAGAIIGYVANELDDCGPPGSCLHWGVLSGQTYLNPMSLIGAPPVRLLPIWGNPPANGNDFVTSRAVESPPTPAAKMAAPPKGATAIRASAANRKHLAEGMVVFVLSAATFRPRGSRRLFGQLRA